jgi:uncharacterized protein (UPF0333 family)
MRTLFKFLMMMVVLATIIGIAYYIWSIMTKAAGEEPLDIVG